jgi:hypothetical protein
MKTIDSALQPITGFLFSITRDTVNGWYEIEIGLPKGWVFDENDEIKCEILNKTDAGSLVKISPKKSDILIDDLVSFVEIIIQTNKRIAEKEKEFTDKMEEMKTALEKEARKFYEELDELKENSFKRVNENFVTEKKETRGRKPKNLTAPESTDNSTTVVTTE